ncbi:hypothetical protein JB92DRAFT_1057588 [Gautieria morchelliformis]|nr:hypothetical protein JB92DRAFT_1057588 [Gautieria morchelliformis]
MAEASPGAPAPFTSKQIAIAGITQVKWALEDRIYEGRSCSIQAATLVMGDLGSTVWSCVIAAHTFTGLALGKHWPRWMVYVTVTLGWVLVVTLTAIGPTALAVADKGPFFSIAAVILVLYGLVFLVLRGSISFTEQGVQTRGTEDVLSRERFIIAKRMLWYPVAYVACILPIAVIRLIGLKDPNVNEAAWIFGMFFLFSLGAVDSVIYTTTRKLIKPINFPNHIRTLSRDTSSIRTDAVTLSRNPSSLKRPSVGEKPSYAGLPGSPRYSDPPQVHKAGVCHGAIRVTLERIQEVI